MSAGCCAAVTSRPQALKDLRDLTRYRVKTVQGRTSEIQRLAKALESAGIKLDSVVSDLTGKSAGLMIGALIDGERRGQVLADLAIGRMRTAGKLADLSQALAGRFTDHHAVLCRLHLDRIALFGTAVAGLEAKIAVKVTPYQRELDLLKSITGFGDAVAQAWLAEIGPAPHEYFASCEKLASWVTLCPGNHMSAGKRRHGRTGDAGTYIKPMLVQAAWSAIKSQGRLQARYCKLVRRFGGPKNPAAVKKAILAVAHTLLKIAYQVLKSGKPYAGPGRRLLHPAGIPGTAPGLPAAATRKAQPGLHHHHHPRGGRLKAGTIPAPFPLITEPLPPRSPARPALPAAAHITPRTIPRRHHGPGFAAARRAGEPSFVSEVSGSSPLSSTRSEALFPVAGEGLPRAEGQFEGQDRRCAVVVGPSVWPAVPCAKGSRPISARETPGCPLRSVTQTSDDPACGVRQRCHIPGERTPVRISVAVQRSLESRSNASSAEALTRPRTCSARSASNVVSEQGLQPPGAESNHVRSRA